MNRKIPLILTLFLALAGISCNGTRTEISGVISGGEESSLILERLDVNRTSLVDSVLTRKDGCELGVKLAMIEGVIISKMAPVRAMVVNIFLIIDSIWTDSNDNSFFSIAKIMPMGSKKNKTIISGGYKI